MRRKSIICLLLIGVITVMPSVSFAQYVAAPRDVQQHWAGNSIDTLMKNGLLSGYENGRFKPDQTMTKEELAVILTTYGKQQGMITETELGSMTQTMGRPSDLIDRWSLDSMLYLWNKGVISADEANRLDPTAPMSRERLAVMLYRFRENVMGTPFSDPSSNESGTPFSDPHSTASEPRGADGSHESSAPVGPDNVPLPEELPFTDISNSYAKNEIIALHKEGILNGYENHTFQPTATVTRAEVATVLQKMWGIPLQPMVRTLPDYNVIAVPYISQIYPVRAMVGCEGTALLMGLHSKGYAQTVDLRQFLDRMPRHQSNPDRGFVGSPYRPDPTKQTRTTISPAKLTEYGSLYGKVENLSGSSVEELQTEILYGNPVVVYATMNWEKPYYRTYRVEGVQKRMLSNNHVVLVCGYDKKNNQYYIADPYNSKNTGKELKYWISGSIFEPIYNERRHAVVVE